MGEAGSQSPTNSFKELELFPEPSRSQLSILSGEALVKMEFFILLFTFFSLTDLLSLTVTCAPLLHQGYTSDRNRTVI